MRDFSSRVRYLWNIRSSEIDRLFSQFASSAVPRIVFECSSAPFHLCPRRLSTVFHDFQGIGYVPGGFSASSLVFRYLRTPFLGAPWRCTKSVLLQGLAFLNIYIRSSFFFFLPQWKSIKWIFTVCWLLLRRRKNVIPSFLFFFNIFKILIPTHSAVGVQFELLNRCAIIIIDLCLLV